MPKFEKAMRKIVILLSAFTFITIVGKENTKGIERNNCRLRHRIRRAFRKTCCFSKKLFNHLKAFELAFAYIKYGFI